MTTKAQTFDCVKMKNRIQAGLMAEFEARRDDFDSYADFIVASVSEHEWSRKQLARIPLSRFRP